MKRLSCLLIILMVLVVASPAYAVPIVDPLDHLTEGRTSATTGISATVEWGAGGFTIDWVIAQNDDDDSWTYTYTTTTPNGKDLSHLILEVTPMAISDDFWDADPFEGPESYDQSSQGGSNPLMPNPIYGIKFNTADDQEENVFTITTLREPVWGNFYVKDGSSSGVDVTAWNRGLETAYADSVLVDDFIVRPNGKHGVPPPIPEPATMLLLGSGLVGMGFAKLKKKRKVQK